MVMCDNRYTNWRSLFVILFMAFTFGCSQTGTEQVVVPSQYNHAKDIINAISKQGVSIEDIKDSTLVAFFNTKSNYSMFLKTNLGILELIHLEDKIGKEFSIAKKDNTDGRYTYSIKKNDEAEKIYDASVETYFNKNDEYIAVTRESVLNEKIKKAFER